MRKNLLQWLLFCFPCLAWSANVYVVSVAVKDATSERIFPTFEIAGNNGLSRSGDCGYFGKLRKQNTSLILLEGKILCNSAQGESYMEMPVIAVDAKGDRVTMEIGEHEAEMWRYTVDIRIRD